MFELFKLVGRVMVDASGANQALSETDRKAQGTTNNLGGYMDKLKGWVNAFKTAIGGSAIVKGLKEVWDMSSQVAEIGDNIDKSSQKFMLSRQAYQKWAYVAERSGTSIDKIGDAIYNLTKNVGAGKAETLALLEELGISAAEAMTATPEELFDMVVKGLRNVDDETRRTYIADTLLSGVAKDIPTIFNMTADEAKKLDDRYAELGGTMSDELVDMSIELKDSQTDLKEAWNGVKNHLAKNTLPGMTKIVDGLTLMLTGDFANGLKTAGDGVVEYLDGLLSAFDEWAGKIRKSIEEATGTDLGPLLHSPPFGFWTPQYQAEQDKIREEQMEQFIADTEAAGGTWNYLKNVNSDALNRWKAWRNQTFGMGGYTDRSGRFANGLPFVPRDDFPARLHYGERVLTRQEAEEYNAGKSNGGNTTINIQTVAQSPAQTAAAVSAALVRARWAM